MSTLGADPVPLSTMAPTIAGPSTAPPSTTSPTTTSSLSSSSLPKPSSSSLNTAASDRQIAEARAALEASMHNIGSHLDTTLKSRAQNLHANNNVLNTQIDTLKSSTKKLSKETDKLKKVVDNAQRKLKELGNVQNWAEVMEREFLILDETVRLADLSEEEEDYGPCRVCGIYVEVDEGNEKGLLWCRGCEGEFHTTCVGLESVPPGEWHCAECEQQGTYLQSVKGKESAGSGNGKAEDNTQDGKVLENVQNPSEPASVAVANGADNDVEMGGMDDAKYFKNSKEEKGKGVEGTVEEVISHDGSSVRTNREDPTVDHPSKSEGEPMVEDVNVSQHEIADQIPVG